MNISSKSKVLSQYIDQYTPIIEQTLDTLRSNSNKTQIPYGQFLFSIIEYFGLLFTVASTGHYNKFDKNNFIGFLKSEYFLAHDHCKASLLWLIRNGLAHQIFPKATGIGTSKVDSLFFKDKLNGDNPTLNLRYLDIQINNAIKRFIQDLSSKPDFIDNLYKNLIIDHYGFDDFKEFEKEIDNCFSGDKEKIFKSC